MSLTEFVLGASAIKLGEKTEIRRNITKIGIINKKYEGEFK